MTARPAIGNRVILVPLLVLGAAVVVSSWLNRTRVNSDFFEVSLWAGTAVLVGTGAWLWRRPDAGVAAYIALLAGALVMPVGYGFIFLIGFVACVIAALIASRRT